MSDTFPGADSCEELLKLFKTKVNEYMPEDLRKMTTPRTTVIEAWQKIRDDVCPLLRDTPRVKEWMRVKVF